MRSTLPVDLKHLNHEKLRQIFYICKQIQKYEYLLLNKPKRTRSSPAFTAVAASSSLSNSTYAQPFDLPDLCVTIRISRTVPNVENISLKN